jgi:hypothetical protein
MLQSCGCLMGKRTNREASARQMGSTKVVVVAVDGTGDGLFVMPVAPVLPTSEPSSSSARSVISDGDRARPGLAGTRDPSARPRSPGVDVVAVLVCRPPPYLVRGSQSAEIEAPRLTAIRATIHTLFGENSAQCCSYPRIDNRLQLLHEYGHNKTTPSRARQSVTLTRQRSVTWIQSYCTRIAKRSRSSDMRAQSVTVSRAYEAATAPSAWFTTY